MYTFYIFSPPNCVGFGPVRGNPNRAVGRHAELNAQQNDF